MTAGPAGDTRARLLRTALKLFTEHGVEGTSLQMIADALGVTKAAVYYHFKAKDEITEAVVEPALKELTRIITEAARLRRRGAQVDYLLDGFVDLVVRHRALVALFSSDPGISRAIEKSFFDGGDEDTKENLLGILAGPDADLTAHITAVVTLTGIAMAGGAPHFAGVDDETLRAALLDVARRLHRRPRR
ncbi:TetR/AcrR family transcriptional regulator [Amycolatopsis samaneae]|uniref:TetR/AcrR family transcriptional regulator n=1 Tax=Amycolatopsis samaneae TaxID=664691 RepID=A0ABW5GP50_9PSEU